MLFWNALCSSAGLGLLEVLKIAAVRCFGSTSDKTSGNKRCSYVDFSVLNLKILSLLCMSMVCVCVWCTCTVYAYGGQRTTLWSYFSLSTCIWVPEIPLGSSGHEASTPCTLAGSALLCS